MSYRTAALIVAAIACTLVSPAHAHHAMDYQMPATFVQGLLSGLGHPVIGIDHLLFTLGAGVLAAQLERGYLLALLFVIASILAAAARAAGSPWEMSELWIAASLVALGGMAMAARKPARGWLAALFGVAGLLHGYALAAAIVGAEAAPLYAYFAGLAGVQSSIALAAFGAAKWLAARRPHLPVQRIMGAAVGVAGLIFAGLIALG